jgi:hypothetical protein
MDDSAGKCLQPYEFDDFVAWGGRGYPPEEKEKRCSPGSVRKLNPTEDPVALSPSPAALFASPTSGKCAANRLAGPLQSASVPLPVPVLFSARSTASSRPQPPVPSSPYGPSPSLSAFASLSNVQPHVRLVRPGNSPRPLQPTSPHLLSHPLDSTINQTLSTPNSQPATRNLQPVTEFECQ